VGARVRPGGDRGARARSRIRARAAAAAAAGSVDQSRARRIACRRAAAADLKVLIIDNQN
jgi:hypothetical protein